MSNEFSVEILRIQFRPVKMHTSQSPYKQIHVRIIRSFRFVSLPRQYKSSFIIHSQNLHSNIFNESFSRSVLPENLRFEMKWCWCQNRWMNKVMLRVSQLKNQQSAINLQFRNLKISLACNNNKKNTSIRYGGKNVRIFNWNVFTDALTFKSYLIGYVLKIRITELFVDVT